MAIVEDIVGLLDDSSLFGDLSKGYEWDSKTDEQILVMLAPGAPSDLKDLFVNEGVQILVRGNPKKSAKDAYALANRLYNFMVSQSENLIINDTRYKGFEPTSNVASLGKDANERHLFSLNFETFRGLN